MPSTIYTLTSEVIGKDRIYIDSGGVTLFKNEVKMGKDSPEFHKKCERMRTKFLELLKAVPCKEAFELDNEYFRRILIYCLPGIIAAKKSRRSPGFIRPPFSKYIRDLNIGRPYASLICIPNSPLVASPKQNHGINTTMKLKVMKDLVRARGKKVHLLGCQT